MKKILNNYAFIDSQNLYLGIKELGWKLDYKRFRTYLREKYGVGKAYIFIGYHKKNIRLYQFLQRCDYELIFKPTILTHQNQLKGNVDAELVLHTMIEFKNYNQAVLVSGDGDFYCLASYLKKHTKLLRILAPHRRNCSILFKSSELKHFITFLDHFKNILSYKKHNHA